MAPIQVFFFFTYIKCNNIDKVTDMILAFYSYLKEEEIYLIFYPTVCKHNYCNEQYI